MIINNNIRKTKVIIKYLTYATVKYKLMAFYQ